MGVLFAMIYVGIAGALVIPVGFLFTKIFLKDEETLIEDMQIKVEPKTLSTSEYNRLSYSERRKYVRNTQQSLPSVHDTHK